MAFESIECCDLGGVATLASREVVDGAPLRPEQPALTAMTDFVQVSPAIVGPRRPIDQALNDMIHIGVRALLVMADSQVLGLITSYDIQGEKPILALQGGTLDDHGRRDTLTVADIMTPLASVPRLPIGVLQQCRVGDVVETFRHHADWLHLLVSEIGDDGEYRIRGIISGSQLDRRLRAAGQPGLR